MTTMSTSTSAPVQIVVPNAEPVSDNKVLSGEAGFAREDRLLQVLEENIQKYSDAKQFHLIIMAASLAGAAISAFWICGPFSPVAALFAKSEILGCFGGVFAGGTTLASALGTVVTPSAMQEELSGLRKPIIEAACKYVEQVHYNQNGEEMPSSVQHEKVKDILFDHENINKGLFSKIRKDIDKDMPALIAADKELDLFRYKEQTAATLRAAILEAVAEGDKDFLNKNPDAKNFSHRDLIFRLAQDHMDVAHLRDFRRVMGWDKQR